MAGSIHPCALKNLPVSIRLLGSNVRTLVVYDDGKMLVDKTNGRALFNDDGTESDFLQNALKLLKDIDAGENKTKKYWNYSTNLTYLIPSQSLLIWMEKKLG